LQAIQLIPRSAGCTKTVGHVSRFVRHAAEATGTYSGHPGGISSRQVPVRALRAVGARAPIATARFTAEITARREAVMMFECIPAPNNVRRERVVISM
jgi:hypothetical protein